MPSLGQRLRNLKCPPSLAACLPGSSRHFGPPRRHATFDSYLGSNSGKQVGIRGETQIQTTPVHRLGQLPETLESELLSDLPDDTVLELEAVRLIGPDGWAIGKNDTFLPETSFWTYSATRRQLHQHPIYLRKRAQAIRRLAGRTLSLASEHCVGSPAHLLCDSLTRLPLALEAGWKASSFDWVYLPRPRGANIERLVARIGVPLERVINWEPQIDIECERVVLTRFPGMPGNPPPRAMRWWQNQWSDERPQKPNKRLYISRQNTRRRLANPAGLENLLAEAGFETCFPDTDQSTAERCMEARWVVALDGSNLANLVFCAPGTSVLVFCPTGFPNPPYTLSLARTFNLQLVLMGVKPVAGSPESDVDLDTFKSALERLLST